jgi:hypothetical protein
MQIVSKERHYLNYKDDLLAPAFERNNSVSIFGFDKSS